MCVFGAVSKGSRYHHSFCCASWEDHPGKGEVSENAIGIYSVLQCDTVGQEEMGHHALPPSATLLLSE